MAENESLDLGSPRAGRWFAVLNAVRKGDSCQKVGIITRKTLSRAIRVVITQFEQYGVTTADFLVNRHSPETLRKLIRQTKGHPYAELLVSVLYANPASDTECLHQWVNAALDKVFDQIRIRAGGSDLFPSFHDIRSFLGEVRSEVRDTLETMAANLRVDPHWKPSVRGKKGEPKVDTTAEMLSMSLVGGAES
jgi:hypothetical protein